MTQIIKNGEILYSQLEKLGLDKLWLASQLHLMHQDSLINILSGEIDENKEIYLYFK